MKDIDDIRRDNLRIIENECGGASSAATLLGMSPSQFANLRDGAKDSKTGKPRGMRKETARRIERAAGRHAGWLDIDHREAETSAPRVPTKNSNRAIAIQRYDVTASMGPGRVAPSGYVDVIEQISINRDYLSSLQVKFTNPDNLAIMSGWGDSMEGTFSSGDPLLVDRGVHAIDDDGVFVAIYRDSLYVKRFQRIGRDLYMMSDNKKKYKKDVLIEAPDSSDFIVLGKVLIAWNTVKMC